MPDKELCPSCHTEIGLWTDDPILTPRGLSGDDYKGAVPVKVKHIKELQDERVEQEIEMGFSEDEKTQFTDITSKEQEITKKHINELRKSTEKLIVGNGVNDDERQKILNEYFNYDEDGEYTGTYSYGQKLEDKEEWTDIDKDNIPNLPSAKIKIKGIHIEDLRHPLRLGWIETWDKARIEDDSVLSDSISMVAPTDFYALGPPYNVLSKTYTAPNKILMADNEWDVTGHRAKVTGDFNFQNTHAIFDSEWSIEEQPEDDKFLEYKGNITNLYWDTGKYQGTGLIDINFTTYPNFKCNKNTKFEINEFNYDIDCSHDTVINASQYCVFGNCWDTVEELNKRIGEGLDKTVIEIRLYFNKHFYYYGYSYGAWRWIRTRAYISYYVSSSAFQFFPGVSGYPASKLAFLISSGNINRNIFDDVKTLYHDKADTAMDWLGNSFDITEDNFDWRIIQVKIYVKGEIRTESVGWTSYPWGVAGYTKNVNMNVDFSINKLRLVNKAT